MNDSPARVLVNGVWFVLLDCSLDACNALDEASYGVHF